MCFDIHSKYAWIVPLEDKKSIASTNTFKKYLNESKRKRNETWVDKCSKLYKRSMKSRLEKNDTEMYWTHNERKPVVVEKFIRTIKLQFISTWFQNQKSVYSQIRWYS